MKAKAIYIPELGKTFFIEEIISISDIKSFKKGNITYGSFTIEFKNKKKKKISNYRIERGVEEDYLIPMFDIKHLEEIRNEFFKYINIINAQETDKEQPKEIKRTIGMDTKNQKEGIHLWISIFYDNDSLKSTSIHLSREECKNLVKEINTRLF